MTIVETTVSIVGRLTRKPMVRFTRTNQRFVSAPFQTACGKQLNVSSYTASVIEDNSREIGRERVIVKAAKIQTDGTLPKRVNADLLRNTQGAVQ